jgi:uracil DNA glycosylase superfamily protein
MRNDIIKLYTEVVSCPLQCKGVTNDRERGIIPRSFFTQSSAKQVEILVVGKNPGQAPEWEQAIYQGLSPNDTVSAHLKLVSDLFSKQRSVGTAFHSNLIRRVSGILGMANSAEEVLPLIALTALVKCQSSESSQDNLLNETIQSCVSRYLMREIELFRPVYLLALGNEVYNYLTSPVLKNMHGLKVGKLYHPSWSNMKGGEENYHIIEIPKLREAYLNAKST